MYEFIYYRVAHVMTRDPITVGPDTTLAEAEGILEARDFNGLPVVDADRRLIGLVTKIDLLRAFIFTQDAVVPHYDEIMRRPVASVMTRTPHVLAPDVPLTRVIEMLTQTGFKSFPVVDGTRLVGIIAREDVLRGLRRAAAGEQPTD